MGTLRGNWQGMLGWKGRVVTGEVIQSSEGACESRRSWLAAGCVLFRAGDGRTGVAGAAFRRSVSGAASAGNGAGGFLFHTGLLAKYPA